MRPTITPFLIGVMFIGFVLAGCEARLNVTSKPNEPTRIDVPNGLGNGALLISEVCYDGVVYLVTDRGGISPKMVDSSAPIGPTSGTFVKRCK